jgi:hypothetical protein
MPVVRLTKHALINNRLHPAGAEVDIETKDLQAAYASAEALSKTSAPEAPMNDIKTAQQRIALLENQLNEIYQLLNDLAGNSAIDALTEEVNHHAMVIATLIKATTAAESIYGLRDSLNPLQDWADQHIEHGEII